jgi:hypothetical protein
MENLQFIQKEACKGVVSLVGALIDRGKQKPALQVLQLLIKDIETMEMKE